ncbi:hypothetical protein Xen7305DRAFT_00029620 [Xenococcus sp. PCC 7305]|uniref:hypothetical protein n=1 Tax=Xenococcus sp. PCC 7305 TaxID=102125 RepID=UPI0002ABF9B5|nr:hypothetical protein [Xenococcus sp. PCC 7305]ELS03242.1 hypothetical protein Xen7305DRAFT_00029620 [Xenococcus sp. PCC 7305]
MSSAPRLNADDSKNREKTLKKLFQQLYQQDCSQQTQEHLVNKIVQLVLLSRTFCRKYQGQSLFGIYRKIYDQVKLQLVKDIIPKNPRSVIDELGTISWQREVKIKAFRNVLDDNKLKQLALAVQGFKPNSELRSYALKELIRAIKISGKLCKPYKSRFSPELYQVVYEEALMETFMYICTKIDNYDSERGQKKFMNWVNFKLEKSFLASCDQLKIYQECQFFESSDLEKIPTPTNTPSLAESLVNYIKKDPEQLFAQSYIKGNPNANFRTIALGRISGQSWQEMAQQFDISISTLSSFYRRSCQRFKSILEKKI